MTSKKKFSFPLFLSFLLPVLIFLGCAAQIGIYPFGEKSLLISDMGGQYLPFLTDYRRTLLGAGGFFYNWHAGLGLNYLGLIAYYLASPFNLLLVLFPENSLIDAVLVLTLLKIGCSGLTFGIFLRGRFKTDDLRLPLFSIFYALCGYIMAYSFDIMWLDGVICLPLLCLAIERMLEDSRRWTAFTLLYGLLLISDYYIAYMVGLFCGLYFLIRLFALSGLKFKTFLLKCFWFAFGTGWAAGLSAFLLVPEFFVLRNNMSLMGQVPPKWETQFQLISLVRKFWIGTFDGMKGCLPHIWCGLLPLCFLLAYFFSRSIRTREKIGSGLLILFLAVSFWLHPLDFFWHAFDYPSWFPYRYSFLLSFAVLTCGFEAFIRTDKKNLLPFLGCVLSALAVTAYYFGLKGQLSRNALFINLAFFCGYAVFFLFAEKSGRAAKILLLGAACAECLLNTSGALNYYAPSYLNRAGYLDFKARYQKTADSLQPGNHEFYRMEKAETQNFNDNLLLGIPGISHFSSTASVRQSAFLKRMGFDSYATWCTYSGGTLFSDSLLGIRYIMDARAQNAPNRVYTSAGNNVWENPYAFPVGFFVPEDVLKLNAAEIEDPAQFQNTLFRAVTGGYTPILKQVPVQLDSMTNLVWDREEGNTQVYRRENPDQPAGADYSAVIPEGGPCTLHVPNISRTYNVTVNGNMVYSSGGNFSPNFVNLGNYDPGTEIRIHVDLAEMQEYFDPVLVYQTDLEMFKKAVQPILDGAPEMTRTSNSRFEFTMEPAGQERLILTSVPYERGWKAFANGKSIPVLMAANALCAVKVPAGTRKIVLDFTPRGWTLGWIVSCISFAVWLTFRFVWRKKKTEEIPS